MTVTFSTRFGGGFRADTMFESMYFPAGEAHVKIIPGKERTNIGPLTQYARIDSANGNDLMVLQMWADACHKRGEKTVLHMPYLPGARADHKEELIFGAAVYADIINRMDIDKVVCFDPHSHIMPELIHNLEIRDSAPLIRQHIVGHADRGGPQKYQGIIAPDKGAVERASRVAGACHLPLYKAEKVRNPDTGKLSGFTCEPLPDEGRFLVVDDICDGGGTFMGLAGSTGLDRDRLGLYVSHGVFSGASADLWEFYGEIWTTDSLGTARNIDRPWLPEGRGFKLQEYPYTTNVISLDRILEGYSA
jgi:ribose-phosphate pyrophosphokinase